MAKNKFQKKKDRERRKKKLDTKKEHYKRLVRTCLMPKFKFTQDKEELSNIPTLYIEKVNNILASFDLRSTTLLETSEKLWLSTIQTDGYDSTLTDYMFKGGIKEDFIKHIDFICLKIESIIYSIISKEHPKKFYPFVQTIIKMTDKSFEVNFSKISGHMSHAGQIWYPPTLPRTKVEDKERVIAFTSHAIDRIAERIASGNPFWNDHTIYEIILRSPKMERLATKNDNYFVLHHEFDIDSQLTDTNIFKYAKGILGEKCEEFLEKHDRFKVKIGYFPYVNDNDFTVLKTCVLPGMIGTPEHEYLSKAKVPQSEFFKVQESLKNSTLKEIISSENFFAMKWFHDRGLKQITPIKSTTSP